MSTQFDLCMYFCMYVFLVSARIYLHVGMYVMHAYVYLAHMHATTTVMAICMSKFIARTRMCVYIC